MKMGKSDQDGRIEEFKAAMNSRNYDEAVQIADTLDIKHIRDNNLLSLIADSYELSNDYELAKHVLLYAYENTKAGRHLAYRLCLVSIKNGEYDEAEEFYEDFVEMAPKDTGRYVLQYEMAAARNESKDKLIKILEEYVNIDMEEKWAYELAKLYKEVGDTDKCVELCDEMGLWFSDGRYIKKAMELKKSIQPLNITQQQLLDKSEPEEEPEEKGAPHVSKSPIASIMEKQPERTPYVDPDEPIVPETPVEPEMPKTPTFTMEPQEPVELKKSSFTFEPKEPIEPKTMKPDLDKPLGESKFEGGIQNLDLSKEFDTPTEPEKKIIGEKVETPLKSFSFNKTEEEYKPSFDITEIKVAEEPVKQPEDILTAQPVEEGPQQMSFFNDDSPSNNKYEAPEPKPSFETPEPKTSFEAPNTFGADADTSEPEIETKEEAPLPDVKDVEDMLKKLQEQGVLGADTVSKAVNIIDNDSVQIEEELKEEVESIIADQDGGEDDYSVDEYSEDESTEEPEAEINLDESEEEENADANNQYMREVPEEIDLGGKSIAENYSEDDDVANAIISGEKKEEPVLPQKDDEERKFHTVQMGSKWEADNERVVDREPVEMGKMDDIEPFEEPGLKDSHTKEINVMQKPTEIMPDSDELEREKNKGVQSAQVLDEAVPPKSELPEEVPVFDLSGEYTSQDNSEENAPEVEEPVLENEEPVLESEEPVLENEELVSENQEAEQTSEVPLVAEDRLEPEAVPNKVLKESNNHSAKIDMIAGEIPDVEPKKEPKREAVQDTTNLEGKDIDKEEPKKKSRKEKKKELNTERVKFDVEDSDMAVFGNYLNVEGLEDNIKSVCNGLIKKFTGQSTDKNANVIVMGDEKTGKTTMAIEIIRLVNKKSDRRNRKVAKISAKTLNNKSFTKVLAKIQGCDLIVENAHDIHITTVQEMVNTLSQNTTDSIIILEAETEPMEELLSTSLRLGQLFNNVIKIKQYNIREWVAYGSDYAKTKGFRLDEVAELALFKSIDDTFGAHKGISKNDVEEIIDNAIDRSSRFGKKLFGSKKDEDGLKLLDESDFNISIK